MSLIVRVIAPIGRDAELIVALLNESELHAESCPDTVSLLQPYAPLADSPAEPAPEPLGPLLITEEALVPEMVERLAAVIGGQPAWSDLPVLILTTGGRSTLRSRMLQEQRHSLGAPILLERPIRTETLVSSVRAAVRARQRQYQVRDALIERDRVLDELREDREVLTGLLLDRSVRKLH